MAWYWFVLIQIFLVILAFVAWYLQKKLRYIYYLRQVRRMAQNKSVNARYFNKNAEALWNDLMDMKIGGWIDVEDTVRGLCQTLLPRWYESMEDTRQKNKEAWIDNLARFFPLFLAIKAQLHYKPQQMVKDFFSGAVQDATGSNLPIPTESTETSTKRSTFFVKPDQKDQDPDGDVSSD